VRRSNHTAVRIACLGMLILACGGRIATAAPSAALDTALSGLDYAANWLGSTILDLVNYPGYPSYSTQALVQPIGYLVMLTAGLLFGVYIRWTRALLLVALALAWVLLVTRLLVHALT